ncbi:hypothetical protein AAG906_003720 [Vitis piasezkii]
MKVFFSQILGLLLFVAVLPCKALMNYTFIHEEHLDCEWTVSGPTLYVTKGETVIVDVYNKGSYNITIHWHGVKMPRYPWSDGPEYVTQCPIQPGGKFSQKIIFSSEEGTLWWHAHSDWSRATVHGAIIIYPKKGTSYPFPKPNAEVPILLGEWWKKDIMEVLTEFVQDGGDPKSRMLSLLMVNLVICILLKTRSNLITTSGPIFSKTFKLLVDYGKMYLLRIINVDMQDILFFSIAKHQITVVGTDASYTKPLARDYIAISLDKQLIAYSSAKGVEYDNTTTTAVVQYNGNYTPSPPSLPFLPGYNDTNASVNFTGSLRSLANKDHPVDVPTNITTQLIFTVSMNTFPCPLNRTCKGPNGTMLAASVNNISFVNPKIDVLEAYYYQINGVFGTRFPSFPPYVFNFTAEYLSLLLELPNRWTEVKVLDYDSVVELVFQGTNLVAGTDHPIHLHGYSFYVVGWGFGNFNKDKDPLGYNLVDPPLQNTIAVPKNGWTTVRFKAHNPGVWLMHCHIERHFTWGMDMVFIVKNGPSPEVQLLPPPPDMPPC